MNKEYITVTSLNNYIKGTIERDTYLSNVYLKGEISNLTKHSSGHWYFSLKDESSRINAVMFRSSALKVNFDAEDGMNVLISGRVSTYPSQGSYQIYVNTMEPDGIGNLYLQFEKLKKELQKEGLFDKKKELPKYPEKIGVITAPTGAAIRDVISTIKRRNKTVEIILFPALVQGDNAKFDLVEKLKIADTYNLDAIIFGRGGGSIEDLWPFNEEIVARQLHIMKTPVVSGVGHEIDFTISDFVSDLRAPTPTGAAEILVPSIIDINSMLNQYKVRLDKVIKNTVNLKYISLKNIKENYILKNPLSMYELKIQKIDSLKTDTDNLMKNILKDYKNKFNNIKKNYILNNPDKLLDKQNNKFNLLLNSLNNLNPLKILERGYSVVSLNDKPVTDTKNIKVSDIIDIRLNKGFLKAEIKEKK